MAERRVSDRAVLLTAAAAVVGVIAFAWVTDLIPGLRDMIAFGPLVIVGLVAITAIVLVVALRPRR